MQYRLLLILLWFLPTLNHAATIEARRFGAIPNDGIMDNSFLDRAIRTCNANDKLILEPGRYDLFQSLQVASKDRLTIDGQGATWVVHAKNAQHVPQNTCAIMLLGCEGVTLQNITITPHEPPYTLGDITAIHTNAFDLKIPPHIPFTQPDLSGLLLDVSPNGPPHGRLFKLENALLGVETLPDRHLRIHSHQAHRLKLGIQVFAYNHSTYNNAIFVSSSQATTFRNISIQNFMGSGFLCTNRSRNIHFESCYIQALPNQPYATFEKGISLAHVGGDVTIKDCVIANTGHAGVNSFGFWGYITNILREQNQLNIQCLGSTDFSVEMLVAPGDTITFYDPMTTQQKGQSTVLSREGPLITLDQVATDLQPNDLVYNQTMHPRLHITGSTFRNSQISGIFLQSPQAIIEECTIENTASPAILVCSGFTQSYGSGPAQDIQIRNNTINNANIYQNTHGAITVQFGYNNFTTEPYKGIYKNITIEGNRIQNTNASGIWVSATDGINIRNNTIHKYGQTPKTSSAQFGVYLSHCRQGRIEGNTITGGRYNIGYRECQDIQAPPAEQPEKEEFIERIFDASQQAILSGCTILPADVNTPNSMIGFAPHRAETYVQWRHITVPTPGLYLCQFRYLNNSGTDRPCQLTINGDTHSSLAFPPTTNKYEYESTNLLLESGDNEITLTTLTTAGGPILDHISIEGSVIKQSP